MTNERFKTNTSRRWPTTRSHIGSTPEINNKNWKSISNLIGVLYIITRNQNEGVALKYLFPSITVYINNFRLNKWIDFHQKFTLEHVCINKSNQLVVLKKAERVM